MACSGLWLRRQLHAVHTGLHCTYGCFSWVWNYWVMICNAQLQEVLPNNPPKWLYPFMLCGLVDGRGSGLPPLQRLGWLVYSLLAVWWVWSPVSLWLYFAPLLTFTAKLSHLCCEVLGQDFCSFFSIGLLMMQVKNFKHSRDESFTKLRIYKYLLPLWLTF